MHELYELKEKLMKELNEYASEEMSAGSLEVIDKLSHAIKNICKIIESAEDEGYSERGNYSREGYSRNYSRERGGRYSREGNRYSYEGGQGGGSYARGRNARRDSMGRYSREGGYSRTDGVEGLVDGIRSMMSDLPQNLQQDAQRFVQKLEQGM